MLAKTIELLIASAAFALMAGAASAAKGPAVTGIDKIHAQTRVGGKICFVDHEHYGEAESATKGGAQSAAKRNWAIFAADEYGTAWGSYEMSVAKSMSCSPAGARWLCKTTARPCRKP